MAQATEYFMAKDLFWVKKQLDLGRKSFDDLVLLCKQNCIEASTVSLDNAPDWENDIGGLFEPKEKVEEMFGIT